MQWQVTKEQHLPSLRKPVLIEGLPGIGNVGKIAVDFLIEELKAEKLYSFFSYKFPHSVFVNQNNLVDMPKIEIYYKKFGTRSKKKDILLLTGDIQPIDEESCYTFCDEVLKIVKHFKCTEIVTTGGIGLQAIPEKPKLYCTSNDARLLKSFLKSVPFIKKEIFGVVGPIVGASGILLGLGKKRKVKGVSLLAETFGHPMYLGIKGGKEVLRALEKRYKYGVNIKKMSKEIIEAENELMKKTKEWISEAKNAPAGGRSATNKMDYIG